MKNNIKKLLMFVLIVCTSAEAQAWKFNKSYFNPAIENPANYNTTLTGTAVVTTEACCATRVCSGALTGGLCLAPNVWVCAPGQNFTRTISTQSVTRTQPVFNNSCIRPSCYYKPVNLALGKEEYISPNITNPSGMPVQPLTSNTEMIRKVVAHLTNRVIGGKIGLIFDARNSPYTPGIPTDAGYVQTNTYSEFGDATGTSAMQGLLWSWRMVSPKWTGVWNNPSSYELEASAPVFDRSALPAAGNSKNVIIISDGLDTDGPQNVPTAVPFIKTVAQVDPSALAADGSDPDDVGFVYDPSPTSAKPIFETCDAHSPIDSISYSDYVTVCDKMAAQGITVHVILYGYDDPTAPGVMKLKYCQEKTGGEWVANATPDNIRTKISEILAAVAQDKIKLIQ